MLSTQNLALRNRRVDEVPSEAGDFARIINGSLFSLNGGRSSESMFDLNRGHLYWITSVLNQFDKTPSAPIKFSERFPKPPNYDSRANSGWGNWGACCFNAQKFPRTCNYFFGPSLVKQNDLSPWMCLCCADLAELQTTMSDNNVFDTQGRLNSMNTSDYTFDRINQMPNFDVVRNLTRFFHIAQHLIQDDHTFAGIDGNFRTKPKKVIKLQHIKDSHTRFTKFATISLPVDAKEFQSIVYALGTAFGLRDKDPTLFCADTSPLNSALMDRMDRGVGERLQSFQTWLSSSVGDADSLVGYKITLATIEFVSQCVRQTDQVTAYNTYFRAKQLPQQKIADHLKNHIDNRDEVVRTRHGKKLDDTTDYMKFLEGLQPASYSNLQSNMKLAYRGQPMTWPIITQVVDLITESEQNKLPTIQALAGAIEEKIDQKLNALSNNTNTNSGQKRRQLPAPYNPCPACGSSKQNPVGDEHHYVVDCPKWDFRLGLDANDDVYVAKCEMRPGCSKTEQPWFKVKQREGTKMYWQQPDFKSTQSYSKMLKYKNDNTDSAAPPTVTFSESSNKRAKLDPEIPPVQTDKSKDTMTSDWNQIFGTDL